MDSKSSQPGSRPRNRYAGARRKPAHIAFTLFCAAALTAAPFSDVFARGFGGGFGGIHFPYGGHFGGPQQRGGNYPGHGTGRSPSHPIYGSGTAPISSTPSEPVSTPPVQAASLPKPQPVETSPQETGPQPQSQPAAQLAQRSRTGVPTSSEKRFMPDQVMFTVSGSPEIAEAIGRRHNLVPLFSKPTALIGGGTMNCYRIADHRAVSDVIHDLEGEQQITWAQPNYIFKLEGTQVGQSLASAQYALTKLHLTEAHRTTEGNAALVAVIDTGIDENHPDLAGSIVDHFDAMGGEMQPDSHGTAMAGAISAHGALVGAAPQAKILAIRAFSGTGKGGTTVHIIKSLNWAYEHHARIVNMSFAGDYDPLLALAISTAHQRGMIIVAAAGNEGPAAAPAYPASDPNVIAVTATDRDDHVFSAANHGSYISLAAPGTDIISTAPSNSYQFSSGTSIAAAHVSGVIALLLSEKPDLGADTIRQVLKDTAHDIGGPGMAEQFGAGLGDAARAVAVIEILRSGDKAGKIAEAKAQ